MNAQKLANLETIGRDREPKKHDEGETRLKAEGLQDGADRDSENMGEEKKGTEKLPSMDLSVTPAGEIGVQGSLVLRVKAALIWARPLLHIGLLMVPTLGFALLAGRRVAILLSASIAVLIESMQVLFGFGFDWMDCLDLLYDAVGIGLGCWLAVWLSRRWSIFYAAKTCVPAIHGGIQDSGE
jgi:hypothetical protein